MVNKQEISLLGCTRTGFKSLFSGSMPKGKQESGTEGATKNMKDQN